MPRPRSRFPSRTQSEKRKTVWVGTATTQLVTLGAGLSVIHSSFDPSALSILAATIVRVRGLVQFHPVAFGVDETWRGAYGLCVVPD